MDANIKKVQTDEVREELLANLNAQMFQLNLQTDLFSTISFPSLPHNFDMLMSKIDFPKKAEQNPNGMLFMNPQDIDRNDAEDIAMQCFGGDKFNNDISALNMTVAPDASGSQNESYYRAAKYALDKLMEDTANMSGSDIEPQDIKEYNARSSKMCTDIIKAIGTYVSRSVDVINPLLQMVGGQGASQAIREVKKTINVANQTAFKNVRDWLDSKSGVLDDKSRAEYREQEKKLRESSDVKKQAMIVYACMMLADRFPNGDRNAYNVYISKKITTIETVRELDDFIFKHVDGYANWNKFKQEYERNGNKPFKVVLKEIDMRNEMPTRQGNHQQRLVRESVDRLNESSLDSGVDVTLNYDDIQFELYNTISSAIDQAIGPRADWTCIKDVANGMKILKDRADKEIEEKIKIVCKTGGQRSIIKHPFKAEGLLSMWSRYSSELQTRIDNRVAQLSGSNGGVDSGSAMMVEDFLKVTYPQIISVLLTYRCVFGQLSEEYKRGYIPHYSLDNVNDMLQIAEEDLDSDINALVMAYDNAQNVQQNP